MTMYERPTTLRAHDDQDAGQGVRPDYKPPAVWVLGTLADLTAGALGAGIDFQSGQTS